MNGWFAMLAFVGAWFLAQVWKFVAGLIRDRKTIKWTDFKTLIGYFMRSGGMPSGHSASMTGLTIYLGVTGGFDSGLFALALATTIIVIYDALHVRYAVGEQGKALNRILAKDGEKALPVVEGHTMPQVVVGVIIGILTGVVIAYLTKA